MRVLELDAASYTRHALHADDRQWIEKNCYWDVWIETVHALGCDPTAMSACVVALDFEGDQWTFFKPPHDELRELYGLDIQELNCWRPLVEHALEHVAAGKLVATEADAWWLPDVSGTDYRTTHTKSTIVINELDLDARRLGYFHNAGYWELSGEDFDRTFRIGAAPDPTFMPFFAEFARVDRLVRRAPAELRQLSRAMLGKHYRRRPADNPIVRFATRFARDLPMLQERGLGHYHAWAFATVRQLGAASELAALYLRWLGADLEPAAAAYATISTGAKTFILKAARAVNSKKPFDPSFTEWANAWDQAMTTLGAIV